MNQLVKTGKFESNPYRPDIPEDFRTISPRLYEFLREVTETLREQHNLTQAGDSTFSWELLTQVDATPRYNPGARGRFYHPEFGIIQAIYCRFQSMKNTEWLGAPLGLLVGVNGFAVTNDIKLSSPELVLGVGGFYIAPPEGSYGWVIHEGTNIQSLPVEEGTQLLTQLAWAASEQAGEAEGVVFGIQTNPSESIEGVWTVPPGGAYLYSGGVSKGLILSWVKSTLDQIEEALTSLGDLQELLDSAEGLTQLWEGLAALESTFASASQHSEEQATQFNNAISSLSSRLSAVEAITTTGGGVSPAVITALREELAALRVDFANQLDGLSVRLVDVAGDVAAADSRISGVRSEISALESRMLSADAALAVVLTTKLTGVKRTGSTLVPVTLNAPWGNYHVAYSPLGYQQSADGIVHMQGAISAPGGSPTTNVTLFTLPAGSRPGGIHMFPVTTAAGVGQIYVWPNGPVIMMVGHTTYTSLCGINFTAVN